MGGGGRRDSPLLAAAGCSGFDKKQVSRIYGGSLRNSTVIVSLL
jgi:hypothetical protein